MPAGGSGSSYPTGKALMPLLVLLCSSIFKQNRVGLRAGPGQRIWCQQLLGLSTPHLEQFQCSVPTPQLAPSTGSGPGVSLCPWEHAQAIAALGPWHCHPLWLQGPGLRFVLSLLACLSLGPIPCCLVPCRMAALWPSTGRVFTTTEHWSELLGRQRYSVRDRLGARTVSPSLLTVFCLCP